MPPRSRKRYAQPEPHGDRERERQHEQEHMYERYQHDRPQQYMHRGPPSNEQHPQHLEKQNDGQSYNNDNYYEYDYMYRNNPQQQQQQPKQHQPPSPPPQQQQQQQQMYGSDCETPEHVRRYGHEGMVRNERMEQQMIRKRNRQQQQQQSEDEEEEDEEEDDEEDDDDDDDRRGDSDCRMERNDPNRNQRLEEEDEDEDDRDDRDRREDQDEDDDDDQGRDVDEDDDDEEDRGGNQRAQPQAEDDDENLAQMGRRRHQLMVRQQQVEQQQRYHEQMVQQQAQQRMQEENMYEEYRKKVEEAALKKTGWLLLASTSRNMTNVLKQVGVTGLKVRQMFSLEHPINPNVLSLILLYKWTPDHGDRMKWNSERMFNPDAQPGGEDSNALVSFMEDDSSRVRRHDVLFCRQTMDNASATQALTLALLNIAERGSFQSSTSKPANCQPAKSSMMPTATTSDSNDDHLKFDVGEKIKLLKAFVRPMDPILRAAAINSSQYIREAHNNAAREQVQTFPNLLDEDNKIRTSMLADELWMYSVFVPARGKSMLYEMEGMSDGAKVLAHCSPSDPCEWITSAYDNISDRVSLFRQHSIPFLLFNLGPSSSSEDAPHLPRKNSKHNLSSSSSARGNDSNSSDMRRKRHRSTGRDTDDDGDNDEYEYDDEHPSSIVEEEQERVCALHNYEPFFVEMLKLMASRGDINQIIRSQEDPPPPRSSRMME